jgi:hypothetical protein
MRKVILMLALVAACGDDDATTPDAAATPDATATLTQDCATYCSNIATACTGANVQFGGSSAADQTTHCMQTCSKFPVGAATDTSMNTLGCRLYHIQNITVRAGAPATHCAHAGPAGAAVSGAATCGDPCESFCTIEIGACGLKPASATGQYESQAACVTACAAFDKTHAYTISAAAFPSTNPGGDSLACRLYHATNAAISTAAATTHCPHTAEVTTGTPCAGAPTP